MPGGVSASTGRPIPGTGQGGVIRMTGPLTGPVAARVDGQDTKWQAALIRGPRAADGRGGRVLPTRRSRRRRSDVMRVAVAISRFPVQYGRLG